MSLSRIQAGRASIETFLDNSPLRRGLKSLEGELKTAGRKMQAIGGQMLAGGLAAGLPLGMSAKVFADFEDKMLEVAAVSGATESQYAALSEQARELGRTTSFTAAQVAGLMAELGRAGFDPSQIQDMTSSVLDLSRATATDATQASGIMSAAIRQFGLQAGDATRVADALTVAANKSFNTLESLGESLTYAGPVAADFNMSIEDTLAILGALGNVGIQGSNAGTAVRRLLTLTGAEAEKLEAIFGVSFVDAAGNARPLVDALDDINRATAGLGTAARAQKFNEAFGLLGITGASAISKNAVGVRDLRDALEQSRGAAAMTAGTMDSGLGGTFRRVLSAVEGVAIAVGGSLSNALQSLEPYITGPLEQLTRFINQNQQLVVGIGATVAAVIAGGAALTALGVAVSAAGVVIGGLSTLIGLILSPLGLALVAVAAVGVALWELSDAAEIFGEAWQGIQDAVAAGDWAAAGEIAMQALEAAWLTGVAKLAEIWEGWQYGIVEGFAGAMMEIQRIWKETQAKISKAIIDQASEEGALGAMTRKWLGFDPRKPEDLLQKQLAYKEQLRAQGVDVMDYNGGTASFSEQAGGLIDDQTRSSIERYQSGWLDTLGALQEDLDRRQAARDEAADAARSQLTESVEAAAAVREDLDKQAAIDEDQALQSIVIDTSEAVDAGTKAAAGSLAGTSGTFTGHRLAAQFTGGLEETAREQLKVSKEQLKTFQIIERKTGTEAVFT